MNKVEKMEKKKYNYDNILSSKCTSAQKVEEKKIYGNQIKCQRFFLSLY